MLISSIAGAVVVVVIAFATLGGSSDESNAAQNPPAGSGSSGNGTQQPQEKPAAPLPSATAREGKTPDTPAPALDPDVLARAHQQYLGAKKKHDDGMRSRNDGDIDTYIRLMKESFAEVQASLETLETYTDWLEHADFGGWAIPADYVALQKRMSKYDRLYARVQKLKQR